MANLGMTINPEEHEERRAGGDVIPAGRYMLHAIASDAEEASSGNGINAWFTMEVMDGEYKGRAFRHYINNVQHSNPTAQKIAQEELAEYCRAVNVRAQDTADFHFKPFVGNVEFIKAGTMQKTFEVKSDHNRVKKYEAIDGARGASAPRQAAPAQASAPRAVAPAATVAAGVKQAPWAARRAG